MAGHGASVNYQAMALFCIYWFQYYCYAADMLAQGDMLMVSASDGGRILTIAAGAEGEIATAPLV